MSIPRILSLSAILSITLCSSLEGAKTKPVAIIYSLAGEASLATSDGASRPVRLFDRLVPGTTVEAGPSSRLAMAFMNGLRYELGEHSQVTLGPRDLASRTGPVRALPRVPPLPRLSPIAAQDRPGPRAGAVRIRGERITGLYPRGGAAALAGETVLRFDPVAATREYRIEVQDSQGRTVFRTDIESPPVKVPAGKLVAGLDYLWTVRTVDRPSAVARGEAEFVILSETAAQARDESRKVLAAEGADSLLLLVEIDRSLGLLLDARENLRAFLADEPGDPVLWEALAEIEMRLEHEDDPE